MERCVHCLLYLVYKISIVSYRAVSALADIHKHGYIFMCDNMGKPLTAILHSYRSPDFGVHGLSIALQSPKPAGFWEPFIVFNLQNSQSAFHTYYHHFYGHTGLHCYNPDRLSSTISLHSSIYTNTLTTFTFLIYIYSTLIFYFSSYIL